MDIDALGMVEISAPYFRSLFVFVTQTQKVGIIL